MADQLTAQQRAAVVNRGGNLLVSAAAGSGKTKVLVERLMSYLTDPAKPENIDSFLIITYTKAAASELRGKIAARLNEAISSAPENRHLLRQMQRLYLTKISTVHSFCSDILKEYAYLMDFSGDFRVADENECVELQAAALERVLDEAYGQAEILPDFSAFVDSQGFGRDDRQIPQLVLSVYRRAKCHLDYEGWLDQCLNASKLANISDAAETVWGCYLIEDLKEYLQLQIRGLERCIDAAKRDGNMEKPVALLTDTVYQLNRLYESNSWDEVIARKEIAYGTLSFSKKCEDTDLIAQIKAVRDSCKNGLKKRLRRFNDFSDQLLADIQGTESSVRGLIGLVRSFDAEYTRLKRSRRILDFGDLEHKTLDLLWGKQRSGITNVAKEIGRRYCQIMVDEYQDSNAVQDAIFRALSSERNNCFMVGDVKQSIYQFRLADPGIFLDKYNRYAHAGSETGNEGRKILLSNNFRSCDAVLDAVNDVFYDCMYEPVGGLRYTDEEALVKGRELGELPDREIELYGICVQNDTYSEEAAFVAKRIKELLDGQFLIRDGEQRRPIKPQDIVILLRSPNSVGRQFQSAISNLGINCDFNGGTELMETEEVQFMHALLQTISNPLQDIPLIAVLSSRVFGFTADELAGIRALDTKSDFYCALQQDKNEKTQHFIEILTRLRMDARMLSLEQLLDRIFLLTDADAIFQSMLDGAERMDNLRSFCSLASSYASLSSGSVDGFLSYLDVICAEGHQIQNKAAAKDAVTIMSIHKSKGLEFPVVFLCGLSKSFNMEQTHESVLCDSDLGLGLSCVDSKLRIRYPSLAKHAIAAKMQKEAISEELRVLYVAMTRPVDRLIMTYAAPRLDKELQELSSRMDMSDPVLLSSDVGSAGEWVLLAALRHSEAAAFHKYARKPDHIRILQHPWLIRFVDEPADCSTHVVDKAETVTVDFPYIDRMRSGLSFCYPHTTATMTPSKLTATQLKGRYKDQEASEGTAVTYHHQFRKPTFMQEKMAGTEYGTAMHTIMQHLRFEFCTDRNSIELELRRLVSDGHITQKIADEADVDAILHFFQTEIGCALRGGTQCEREFKFSLLDDAERYVPGALGEKVLLQGVVDCALISQDGITVVDFKTDRIKMDQLNSSVAYYENQVKSYAYALEKIYGLPVKDVYLYYFRLKELIQVHC